MFSVLYIVISSVVLTGGDVPEACGGAGSDHRPARPATQAPRGPTQAAIGRVHGELQRDHQ